MTGGAGAGLGAGVDLRRRSRKKAPIPIKPIRARPPTTPPTMAPTGVGLLLWVGTGTTDVVVVCVFVTIDSRDLVVSGSVTVGKACDDAPPIVVVRKVGFSSPS